MKLHDVIDWVPIDTRLVGLYKREASHGCQRRMNTPFNLLKAHTKLAKMQMRPVAA